MESIIEAPATEATELDKVRAYLHGFINEAENVAVLEAIATLLTTALPPAPLPEDRAVSLEELLPAERAAVEEGLRDIEAGRVIPHAEVWAEIEAKYGLKYPR